MRDALESWRPRIDEEIAGLLPRELSADDVSDDAVDMADEQAEQLAAFTEYVVARDA